jgi:hypothetical protein
MALHDSVLGMFRKEVKDPNAPKPAPGSRSEREAKIKDKAGLVINVFALLLAVNTWYGGKLSSTVMNNTISANDTYNFYQAKSIKQTQYQLFSEDTTDAVKSKRWAEKAAEYDVGPEGKVALLAKAEKLVEERDIAKKRSPWIGYATTAYQLAIVVLSASILAVSMSLFWGSFAIAAFGLFLSSQGVFLWF